MSGSERVREWAKTKKADLQTRLEMMEAGRLQTREKRDRDGAFVDTTAASMTAVRNMIADMDRIIEGGRPDGAGGASVT